MFDAPVQDQIDFLERVRFADFLQLDFLESVRFADFLPHHYSIGTPGNVGFGVGVVPVGDLPSYLSPMPGTYEFGHDNYGNYQDTYGNIYVCIPKCYYKYNVDNTIEYSSVPKDGYVIERAFINGGGERSAIFVAKYQGSNNGGIFGSIKGVDPVSTHTDHNPIANINGCSVNRYDELYTACKSIGNDFFATPIFVYSMLARMAKAHAGAANGVANCAWNDIAPYMPKGCNNNALKDANDNSVIYEGSGYSNCGKTGSGVPFAKTTHNGQNCGIADINGNMWEITSGFIRNSTDFLILKESVDIATLTKDTAYDYSNYDTIDLSDLISGNDGWIKLGNGSNQVFGFSVNRSDLAYRKTSLGIPLSTGTSSAGTTEFGNDGIYRYLRTDMACLVGGNWYYGSLSGGFTLYLDNSRAHSNYNVGGRASVFL